MNHFKQLLLLIFLNLSVNITHAAEIENQVKQYDITAIKKTLKQIPKGDRTDKQQDLALFFSAISQNSPGNTQDLYLNNPVLLAENCEEIKENCMKQLIERFMLDDSGIFVTAFDGNRKHNFFIKEKQTHEALNVLETYRGCLREANQDSIDFAIEKDLQENYYSYRSTERIIQEDSQIADRVLLARCPTYPTIYALRAFFIEQDNLITPITKPIKEERALELKKKSQKLEDLLS